ncbi:MAG: glycosyltransferase [Thermus sp.]
MPRWLAAMLLGMRTVHTLKKDALRYYGFTNEQIDSLRKGKVIVFHDYRLAFSYMRSHSMHPEQAILLMSHSPTDASSEKVEDWRSIFGDSAIWKEVYEKLVRFEFETFLKVKGVIAPCRNSLEGYFLDFPRGRNLLKSLAIYEVKTGVRGLNAVHSRREIRERWGIAPDDKVVGYFGRRHHHKGFDLFVRLAELAYERGYTGVWFVSAGKGYLPSPSHLPNYLDLGYLTEQLADAVAAVDLVVVPNRFSYFDLFILEAMSLEKVVLTSRVGGNVCFDAPGVLLVNELSAESLLQAIEELLSNDRLREFLGRKNREVFEKEYNLPAFAKRHLLLAETLLGGRY